MVPPSARPHGHIRFLVMMLVTLLVSAFAFAAEDDEPLILGVTNVGEASRALRALGIQEYRSGTRSMSAAPWRSWGTR